MESTEKAAQRIFGERTQMYSTSSAHTDPQVLARVVQLASPGADWSALDVATGTGHTAFALAPHLAQVIGIDLTFEMLAEGRRLREANEAGNVEFCVADVHALPFRRESFQLITCRRAAHHFSNIGLALSEMWRVLRPGGRLVIDDRSVPEDSAIDAYMNDLDYYHDESHVREYPPSEWQVMLEQAGFRVTAVEPFTKHRPLTSLTDGVSGENVHKIHQLIGGLSVKERQAMNIVDKQGEIYLNHWYVIVACDKPQHPTPDTRLGAAF